MKVVLASNMYPSAANPHLGIFVAEQERVLARDHGVEFVRVVSARDSRGLTGKCLKYSELYVRAMFAAATRADLVHLHYPSLVNYPAGLLPSLMRGRPLVVTLHGDELKLPGLATPRGRLLAQLLRRSAHTIAVSEENAGLARAAGVPAEHISVIDVGVNVALFEPVFPADKARLRAERGLPADRPVVLFVARLTLEKGFPRLLAALSALAPELAATLVIIGDGPERARYQALVDASPLAGHTRWLGLLGHDALRPWFQVADVLALPSDREGMPVVVMEAMASGTPVVASRVGGLRELVREGENGILCAPDDAAAWLAGLGALLRDPSLRERMARGAHQIIGDHSLEAQATRVFRVYASVSGRRARVSA